MNQVEEDDMSTKWNPSPIGLPHRTKGLGPHDGKDPLLSKGNDGEIYPPPQGKA
jgi:hypothetical protein